MTIDENDTTTMDLLESPVGPVLPTVTVEGWGTGTIAELEHHLRQLKDERDAGWDRVRRLQDEIAPLADLAAALAALPVFREMADDLDDLRDRVNLLERAAEEIPTVDDVAEEIEYRGTIESAVETILADRADDPADNIDELAKAVADRLSVEVEIDSIATVSVS
jgi:chromosome segregation ATPase